MSVEKKVAHFLYMPLTGLGLYGGHRGSRWLRNRIKIFKQFVLPSLLAQTNKDFILWVSVRYEDRHDKRIAEFKRFLEAQPFRVVCTYAGICFWDDKYPDDAAYSRLVSSIHDSTGDLLNAMGECDEVLMTIQPSDDCYHKGMVMETQDFFKRHPDIHCFGYSKGYVMDYVNHRLAQWNPKTTPPFYTIRFKREVFTDPLKHVQFTGPYKSHEYVKDYIKSHHEDYRGFIVGTHYSNISTVFDHPYTGHEYLGDNVEEILSDFALEGVEKLKPGFSLFAPIFHRMPYSSKKKLRHLAGEKKSIFRPFFSFIYNVLRS